jgi:CBS-domain-containing membrane protein
MTAAMIMLPNPTVLKPTDLISTAARCIMEHRYRSVPVVDEDGCYMGMFGVNCLLRQVTLGRNVRNKVITPFR